MQSIVRILPVSSQLWLRSMKFKTLKILLFNCSVPPLFFCSFPIGISLSLLRGEHSLILFWDQCANSSSNNNSSVGGGGGGGGCGAAAAAAAMAASAATAAASAAAAAASAATAAAAAAAAENCITSIKFIQNFDVMKHEGKRQFGGYY